MNTNPKKQIALAKKLIDDDSVKTVSFDVFDTLLVRAAAEPKDVFRLADIICQGQGLSGFMQMRENAEKELNDPFADIYGIWDYIRKKHGLEDSAAEKMMNAETETEAKLLYPRKQIKELYEYAAEKGKTIIACSDMYLPGKIIKEILQSKGYDRITDVMVSCDIKARKDSGAMYDKLKERYDAAGILHIGDNRFSDFAAASEKGIRSVYIPSNISVFERFNPKVMPMLKADKNFGAAERTAFGFAVNRYMEQEAFQTGKYKLNLTMISDLFLFPFILKIISMLISDERIIENYDKIYFASRDGHLPFEIYRELCGQREGMLRGEYLYVSRQAYRPLYEETVFEGLRTGKFTDDYTLKDYLRSVVTDDEILEKFCAELDSESLGTKVGSSVSECERILADIGSGLSDYYSERKKAAAEYYASVLNSSKERLLVFDCGYGGSVSEALGKAVQGRYVIDKLYLWESEENKERDKKNGTHTYTAAKGMCDIRQCMFYENLFSPLQGSCKGITEENGELVPKFGEEFYSDGMKADIARLHKEAKECTMQFALSFGSLLPIFKDMDLDYALKMLEYYFCGHELKNVPVLKNIRYPDETLNHITLSLDKYFFISNHGRLGRLLRLRLRS